MSRLVIWTRIEDGSELRVWVNGPGNWVATAHCHEENAQGPTFDDAQLRSAAEPAQPTEVLRQPSRHSVIVLLDFRGAGTANVFATITSPTRPNRSFQSGPIAGTKDQVASVSIVANTDQS